MISQKDKYLCRITSLPYKRLYNYKSINAKKNGHNQPIMTAILIAVDASNSNYFVNNHLSCKKPQYITIQK